MAKTVPTNTIKGIPEILVYGLIGSGEGMVSSADFVGQLKSLEKDNPKINVRINSGGGSIFDGIAMYSAVKNSTSKVDTYVDGVAASMASVLALAGDKCFISKNARIMTHRAKGAAVGGADSMRQNADLLDSLEDTMAVIYASKCGLTKVDAKTKFMGLDDKWMTAQQALDEKLVDGIFDATASIQVPVTATTETEVWQAYSKHFNLSLIQNKMDTILLTADQLGKLNLKVDSPVSDIQVAIDGLLAKAAEVDGLKAQLVIKDTELGKLKTETEKKEVETIIATALKENRITVALGDTLKAQFGTNVAGLKAVVDNMPVYSPITAKIANENEKGDLAVLSAKTYDELDKEGTLPKLKALSLDAFKAKFKEAFGKEYSGS